MNNTEWKIAKSTLTCKGCGEKFAPGAAYYSALFAAGSGFERQDYCRGCFQARGQEGVFSFWKTSVPDEDAEDAARPVVDLEAVLEFFRRLAGDADPRRQAFRFVLALMLARKKVLKLSGTAGTDALVFVERKGGERHDVAQPALGEGELAAVGEELGRLLGLAPPTPAAATAAVATAAATGAAPEQAGPLAEPGGTTG